MRESAKQASPLMDATIYFDLARKDAYESLNGGSRFELPPLKYGEDVTFRARFATRTTSGDQVEISRAVNEVRASIGRIDARPESGSFTIKVGPLEDESVEGVNVTTALPFNASAKQVQDALNALSLVGTTYGAATVTLSHGSWIVEFADEVAAVDIHADSNSLFPLSFLRVRAHQFNGQFQHDLRLIQAPVASTDQSARVVPKGPTITEKQAGFFSGETAFPEIQKLYIPPTFRGTYQIRRGFEVSALLKAGGSDADGPEEIAEAINALADDNSGWDVTNPSDGVALLTATGDWVGDNIDLLEVDIFDAPEGDLVFTLSLDTPELFTLLRAQETVTLPVEIEADIQDENDSELVRTMKLFSGEVEISRELHWEELSVAASIDWLRPPLPKDYKPFSTSQISNGQLHYAQAIGNGALTVFPIDHNLNTDRVDVIVHTNAAAGAPLVYGTDYTWTRVNSNTLEITWLNGVPTAGQYLVTVLGLELTSFFDDHDHEIEEVNGLRAALDDLGGRVTSLENRSGGGTVPQNVSDDQGESARWQLPAIFEVYPSREPVPDPAEGLAALDRSVLPRARGLLPAIHDATTEDMPAKVGIASASDAGRVLENNTGSTVLVPVGLGHRAANVKPGEFIASDGRLWYPVTRFDQSGRTFTTDYATDAELFTDVGHVYPNGTRGQLTTTDTLPGGASLATDYYVIEADFVAGTYKLATSADGEAITLADDGTGTHTFTPVAETSYYPRQFERELFTIHVNEKQFRVGKTFEANFALQMAVIGANTAGHWTLRVELGEAGQAAAPTGLNLSNIVWRETPILEQRLIVTPVTATHRFGVKFDRYLSSGEEKWRVARLLYGASEGGFAPPETANFALRARLTRFDTEDGESDPRGFIALKGLTFEHDDTSKEGFAFIS